MKCLSSILCCIVMLSLGAVEIEVHRLPADAVAPQMQTDANGTIHLMYVTGDVKAGNIQYTTRAAGEKEFADPITVNSIANSAMVIGGVRAPDMAVNAKGDVHIVWMFMQKGQGNIFASRKLAEKKSFIKQTVVSGKTDGLDAGVAVAVSGDDVYAVWPAHGAENAEAQRLIFVAYSKNAGKTFGAPQALNSQSPGVCACCDIDAGVDAAGKPWVIYRNVDGMQRNTVLLSKMGKSYGLQLIDTWKVNQCPMSSSYIGSGKDTFVAWQTADQVLWAPLIKGKIGDKRPAFGMGKKRKHPIIAENKTGERLMLFSEGTGWNKGGRVEYHLLDKDGKLLKGDTGNGLPAWSRPALTVLANENFLIAY